MAREEGDKCAFVLSRIPMSVDAIGRGSIAVTIAPVMAPSRASFSALCDSFSASERARTDVPMNNHVASQIFDGRRHPTLAIIDLLVH